MAHPHRQNSDTKAPAFHEHSPHQRHHPEPVRRWREPATAALLGLPEGASRTLFVELHAGTHGWQISPKYLNLLRLRLLFALTLTGSSFNSSRKPMKQLFLIGVLFTTSLAATANSLPASTNNDETQRENVQRQAASIRASQVQAARVRAAQMKAAEMMAARVRAAQVRAAQIKAAEMMAARVRTAQVKAAQMKAAEIMATRVRAAQMKAAEIMAARVRAAQWRAAQQLASRAAQEKARRLSS